MNKTNIKALLVATALTAAPGSSFAATTGADAPAPAFNMTVGGYFEAYGAVKTPIRHVGKQRNYGLDFYSDAELDFRFDGEHGGWKYGAVIELLANPGESLSVSEDGRATFVRALAHKKSIINADETFGYMDSDRFGRFEFGNTNSAPYKMGYLAPASAATGLIDGNYPDFLPDLPSDYAVTDIRLRQSDDALKFTYFTPRWRDLQFGVSYAPNPAREGRRVDFTRILERNFQTITPRGTDVLGLDGAAPLSNADYKHSVELGLNYVRDFNDVSLAVSGGYTRAVPRKKDKVSFEDWQSFSVGLNVGYKGFTVGGNFVWDGKTGLYRRGLQAQGTTGLVPAKAKSSVNGYGYTAGLQYEFKDFIVGAAYSYGQGAGNTLISGKNCMRVFSIGTTYHLFPGLDVISEFTYRDVCTKSLVGTAAVLEAASIPNVKSKHRSSKDYVMLSGIKITL